MSLLKLKSIFSPTSTKFEKSDLTTFSRQFDNDFQQTNLQNLDSIYDDGLNVPTGGFKRFGETFQSQFDFNTIFDDGLNVATSGFKRFGETFQSQFDFNTIFDDNLSVPTSGFTRNGQIFQSQFDFNTIFDDGLGLPIFNNTIDSPPTTFQVQLSGGFRGNSVIEDFKSIYQDNKPIDKFDTRLNYNENSSVSQTFTSNPLSSDLTQRGGRDNPPLDSALRGRVYNPIRFSQDFQNDNLFVKPETGPISEQLFKDQTFDPRATTPKEGTLYFNTNNSFNPATNPTDFSTAIGNNDLPFTPITSLGGQFKENLSWENLYNSNHTPRDVAQYKGKNGISYGPNVNRDKLSIRDSINNPTDSSIFSLSRTSLLFPNEGEPYVVSDIPSDNSSIFDGSPGRLLNQGPIAGIPLNRMLTDTARITKFLSSPKGIGFIASQNILGGFLGGKSVYLSKDGKLQSSKQRFKSRYNPLSTLAQTVGRAGFGPLVLRDKTEPGFLGLSSLFGSDEYGSDNFIGGTIEYKMNDTFTEGSSNGDSVGALKKLGNKLLNALKAGTGQPVTIKEKSDGGDKMTLAKIVKGSGIDNLELEVFGQTIELSSESVVNVGIEDEVNGMPFYFKDMRDNSYVFFRAFIEGLTENISPSYASHNYMGRSEPVYIYERAEREISMTLKLVAQTQEELDLIYTKMNRLTSLCYPQYTSDVESSSARASLALVASGNPDKYGNRMIPPLTKLRYGELFGSKDKELMGYIKSLSYSVDQSSTYETTLGKRVPRHVLATIGYQVIHDKAPRLGTEFYGYVGSNGEAYKDG